MPGYKNESRKCWWDRINKKIVKKNEPKRKLFESFMKAHWKLQKVAYK